MRLRKQKPIPVHLVPRETKPLTEHPMDLDEAMVDRIAITAADLLKTTGQTTINDFGPVTNERIGRRIAELTAPPISLEELEKKMDDPLKALARDLRALTYGQMLVFAKGTCEKDKSHHEQADRIHAWCNSILEDHGETLTAQPFGQQDAGAGD